MIAIADFELAIKDKLLAQRSELPVYLESAPSEAGEPFFRVFHVSTLVSGITSRMARYECEFKIYCHGVERAPGEEEKTGALDLQQAAIDAFEAGFIELGGRTLAVSLEAVCKNNEEPSCVRVTVQYDDNRAVLQRPDSKGELIREVNTRLYQEEL